MTEEERKRIVEYFINIRKEREPNEYDIPFEHDENGTLYGYKILVSVPEYHPWLVSPNLSLGGIWKNDVLIAHAEPEEFDIRRGIHGTKNINDLKEWYDQYRHMFNPNTSRLFIVKIALWGTVIETEKGFRAEHAKIMKVLREL